MIEDYFYSMIQVPGFETEVIDLPEIDQILIIGASDTSIDFSESVQELGLFTRVYHVESLTQAIGLLKSLKFAVVIIDHEDRELDTISASRLININAPLTRIILISSSIKITEVLDLKNKGIIHGYIGLPERDLVIHSIVIKEQSTYQINQSLLKLIKSPPKFTTLHDKLMEKPVAAKHYQFKFLGMAVLESTVLKYSFFIGDQKKLDPILSSSYLSAMTIYGKTLFEEDDTYPLSYVEFGDTSIFIKTIEQYQFLFFITKREDTQVKIIEDAINSILNRFQIKFQEYLSTDTDPKSDYEFQSELNRIMRMNNEQNLILDYDQKTIIGNYDLPDDTLLDIFEKTDKVYEVHDFIDERHLFDFLKEEICHVLLINNVSTDLDQSKAIIQHAKKISPYTQIIAVLTELDAEFTGNLLNQDAIDKIIYTEFEDDEYYSILKQSIERSKKIRKLSDLRDLYQFYLSSDRTEVIKTLLLSDPRTLHKITIPEYHGMIVLEGKERVFSDFLLEQKFSYPENEDVLVSFMLSLMDFSAEYSNYRQSISSVKFGRSNIVVQKLLNFSFIYFIGSLDQSNIEFVQEQLLEYSQEFFDIVLNAHTFMKGYLASDYLKITPELEKIIINRSLSLIVELVV